MSNALMDLLKQKKAQLGASRRAKTVKPPMGHSRWRILPGWEKGSDVFYHDFGQHFIKDTLGEIKAVYMCVDKTYGKPCSICAAIQHAIVNTEDDVMVKMLKEAKASHRILVNAIQVDGTDPNTPVILELAPTAFEQIVSIIMEHGAEMLSLDKGKPVIIEKTGKAVNTKYAVQPAAHPFVVDPSIMTRITNLDEYVAQESEEAANRALSNLAAVTGLLPPAGVRPTAPRTSLPPPSSLKDIVVEDDVLDVTEVDDADKALRKLEMESEPAPAAKPAVAPAKAKAKAAPVVEETGDPELDALLAELGG